MELIILIIITYFLFCHKPFENKTDFERIPISTFFCFRGCMGTSEWLKINDERAVCIHTNNGRYELNQEKRFTPNTVVYKFENK